MYPATTSNVGFFLVFTQVILRLINSEIAIVPVTHLILYTALASAQTKSKLSSPTPTSTAKGRSMPGFTTSRVQSTRKRTIPKFPTREEALQPYVTTYSLSHLTTSSNAASDRTTFRATSVWIKTQVPNAPKCATRRHPQQVRRLGYAILFLFNSLVIVSLTICGLYSSCSYDCPPRLKYTLSLFKALFENFCCLGPDSRHALDLGRDKRSE